MAVPLVMAVPLIVAPVAALWGAKALQARAEAPPATSGGDGGGSVFGAPGGSGGGAAATVIGNVADDLAGLLDAVLPAEVGRRSTGAPIPEGAPRHSDPIAPDVDPAPVEGAPVIEDSARRDPDEAGARRERALDRASTQAARALSNVADKLSKRGR